MRSLLHSTQSLELMATDGCDPAPLALLTRVGASDPMLLAGALADASAAVARLDQALAGHPLAQAFLYRARLESVRRMAAVDGQLIDPWHLAATIEGLRLRMDPYLRIIDRGDILDKAKFALGLHQWIVEPDFDQEGEVQRAEALLARQPAALPPMIAGAHGLRDWIESGETRPAMRAAMVRFWQKRGLLRLPVPLTGAASLGSEQSWEREYWLPAFMRAVEREAADAHDLLYAMERAWFESRSGIARRRKDSHVTAAVDLLAAAPVLSATTLARILGIAIKSAIRVLDELVATGIAIEVTHRSKRRLFGLQGLAPLRRVVQPPYRPDPSLGPGRPRHEFEEEEAEVAPPPLPPLTPLERRDFDYTVLEEAMAHLDAVVRASRSALRAIADGTHAGGGNPAAERAETTPDC